MSTVQVVCGQWAEQERHSLKNTKNSSSSTTAGLSEAGGERREADGLSRATDPRLRGPLTPALAGGADRNRHYIKTLSVIDFLTNKRSPPIKV